MTPFFLSGPERSRILHHRGSFLLPPLHVVAGAGGRPGSVVRPCSPQVVRLGLPWAGDPLLL